MKRHNLSICLITKDSHDYIEEWIEYHLKIGIDHIYIYDDGSEPWLYRIILQYCERALGRQSLIFAPNKFWNDKITYQFQSIPKPSQLITYHNCIKDHAAETQWLAFIDDDEFLFSKQKPLKELLKDYEQFGALGVHWLIFGSSGHITKPVGGILKNFINRSNKDFIKNKHIKSIVNTDYPFFFHADPHLGTSSKSTVNENFEIMTGPNQHEHTSDKIVIHHYYCKSKEQFNKKINVGRVDIKGMSYNENDFELFDRNEVYDNSINE